MKLINELNNLRNSEVKETVKKRLKEFESFNKKDQDEWFSELGFCILTANSRAETGINIQKELGKEGFCNESFEKIRDIIIKNKHRFHNNKAKYIVQSREFRDIKDIIKNKTSEEAREFLVKNIKGLGWKEASHYLRNIGRTDVAILDRHILKLMFENEYIDKIPKGWNKKNYCEIEQRFSLIAKKLNINLAELDLYMWYMKTGKVLK